jgi:hypothetical protein
MVMSSLECVMKNELLYQSASSNTSASIASGTSEKRVLSIENNSTNSAFNMTIL